jgi:hypothetical protein
MPVVPNDRLGNVGLRPVGGSGLNRVHTSPDDFGAAEARGLAAMADTVGGSISGFLEDRQRAKQKIQEERDTLDVLNTMNTAELEVGEYLRGATGKKLQEARGVADATSAWLDEYGAKAKMRLSPRAQQAFQLRFANTINDALNRTAEHESRELQAEKDAVVKNSKTALLDRVAANYGDELARKRAMSEYEQALAVGVGNADERARMKAEFASEAHLAIVDRMAVDDAEAALAYFDEHQGEIAGTEHAGVLKKFDGLKKVLEERVAKGMPVRLAEQALAQGGTFEEQAMWIRSQGVDDVDVVDKAVDALRDRYEESERSADFANKAAMDNARATVTAELEAAATEGRPPRPIDSIVPVTLQAELQGTERWSSLVSFYEKRAKGEKTASDRFLFWQLKGAAQGFDIENPDAAEDPALAAKFGTQDLWKFREQLSDEDFDALMKLQIDARESTAKAKATALSAEKKAAVREQGLLLKTLIPSDIDQQQKAVITQRFDDAITRWKARNDGKEPDRAALDEMKQHFQFNPPGETTSTSGRPADLETLRLQMPEVGGAKLHPETYAALGRAIQQAGGKGTQREIERLAAKVAEVESDPNVYLTADEYMRLWKVMKAEGEVRGRETRIQMDSMGVGTPF